MPEVGSVSKAELRYTIAFSDFNFLCDPVCFHFLSMGFRWFLVFVGGSSRNSWVGCRFCEI